MITGQPVGLSWIQNILIDSCAGLDHALRVFLFRDSWELRVEDAVKSGPVKKVVICLFWDNLRVLAEAVFMNSR